MTTPKQPDKRLVDFFAGRSKKIEQAIQWILGHTGKALPEEYDDLDTLELRTMVVDLGKMIERLQKGKK